MATKREQIMVAMEAALATVTGVTAVYRSRADKFSGADSPALNLMPDNEDPAENNTGQIDATLAAEVQVFVRGVKPDSLADPYVQQVHAKLMTDPTLGGLAIDVSEAGTSWDFDETDRTALLVRMRYRVWYRHNRSSL